MASVYTLSILSGWVGTSCLFSTYANTAFLNQFDDAFALTFFRFAGSALFGFITNYLFTSSSIGSLRKHISILLLPSILLLSANFFNSVALNLTGISVTYITKSTIPIWTALITVIYYKQKPQSYLIYSSLIPTVIGVAMSSLSDIEFNPQGFMAAIASTLSQTMLNIVSRNIMNDMEGKLNGSQFQFIMVSINTIILYPFYFYFADQTSAIYKLSVNDNQSMFVFIAAPLAYHIEYVLNCLLVGRISSLAFSMIDITRRLLIIICGVIMFDKQLNLVNNGGIVLALGGVACYSYLTNQDKNNESKQPQN